MKSSSNNYVIIISAPVDRLKADAAALETSQQYLWVYNVVNQPDLDCAMRSTSEFQLLVFRLFYLSTNWTSALLLILEIKVPNSEVLQRNRPKLAIRIAKRHPCNTVTSTKNISLPGVECPKTGKPTPPTTFTSPSFKDLEINSDKHH